MKLNDFLAKCPICGEVLKSDHGGCPSCINCIIEYDKKYGGGMESIEHYVKEVQLRIWDEMDIEILFIDRKQIDKLNKILSQFR